MKTEDIDKRIGMPDVDAEWAKFEREVIGEAKADSSHRSVMLWGLSIAASIALVAGIFLFGKDNTEQADNTVAIAEQPEIPISQESVTTVAEAENAPEIEKTPANEMVPANEMAPKTKKHSDAGMLASATPSETKNEEVAANPPAAEESDKVFATVEQSPSYPGGYKALQELIEANKHYDGLAQEYGARGRVVTTFLIDSLGYVSDIKVQRCLLKYDTLRLNRETEDMQQQVKQQIETQLGEESTRIVSLIPRWSPGKINGKAVSVKYSMPILFP